MVNRFSKIDISAKLIKAILFKKRIPLIIGWNITYRCNLKCEYCGYWERESKELDSDRVFCLIEELSALGTKFMVLSGGEPLLREDLKKIIDFCKKKNMYVIVNSNGTLIKDYFERIKNCDEIRLSLDGPKDINDLSRGRGVHDKVIEAIKICRDNNLKTSLTTVISKHNTGQLSYLLGIAKKNKIGVFFQPAGERISGKESKIFLSQFDSKKNDYKNAIEYLITEKRRGNRFINNSLPGLRSIYYWSNLARANCMAGFFSCIMEPDGRIYICDMTSEYPQCLISTDKGFKQSFESLNIPHLCEGRCNALMLEINLMARFNPLAIFEALRNLSVLKSANI